MCHASTTLLYSQGSAALLFTAWKTRSRAQQSTAEGCRCFHTASIHLLRGCTAGGSSGEASEQVRHQISTSNMPCALCLAHSIQENSLMHMLDVFLADSKGCDPAAALYPHHCCGVWLLPCFPALYKAKARQKPANKVTEAQAHQIHNHSMAQRHHHAPFFHLLAV